MTEIHAFDPDGTPSPGAQIALDAAVAGLASEGYVDEAIAAIPSDGGGGGGAGISHGSGVPETGTAGQLHIDTATSKLYEWHEGEFPSVMTGGSGYDITDPAMRGVAQAFTDTAGYAANYKVYSDRVDPAQPVGLMLWFHGDGGMEFYSPDRPVMEVVKDAGELGANSIVVILQSPDPEYDMWWKKPDVCLAWVREWFADFTSRVDIDLSRVWIAGFSGGAEFSTTHLLPSVSSMGITSGSGASLGGGGVKDEGVQAPLTLPDAFWVRYTTGTVDDSRNSTSGYDGYGHTALAYEVYSQNGTDASFRPVPGSHVMGGNYTTYITEYIVERHADRGSGWRHVADLAAKVPPRWDSTAGMLPVLLMGATDAVADLDLRNAFLARGSDGGPRKLSILVDGVEHAITI